MQIDRTVQLALLQAAVAIYVVPDGAQPRSEHQAVSEAMKLWGEVLKQSGKENEKKKGGIS